MVTVFGLAGLYALLAFVMGFRNFWADMGEKMGDFATPSAFGQALWDAGTLKYMDGGGDGCADPDKPPSYMRQEFHHLTSYGFLLCFAATCAGTVLHYIGGRHAPYGMASLPVVLGTIGGIGLLIGPAGLLWIKWKTDPQLVDEKQRGMDVGFLVLLFLTSLTGFLLLLWRETPAMGITLAVHLGVVMGLFVTMPYGKFVHAIYRFAALVRFALESKRPNTNASFEG
jgi:citrate/tricarballylate utilization protein